MSQLTLITHHYCYDRYDNNNIPNKYNNSVSSSYPAGYASLFVVNCSHTPHPPSPIKSRRVMTHRHKWITQRPSCLQCFDREAQLLSLLVNFKMMESEIYVYLQRRRGSSISSCSSSSSQGSGVRLPTAAELFRHLWVSFFFKSWCSVVFINYILYNNIHLYLHVYTSMLVVHVYLFCWLMLLI